MLKLILLWMVIVLISVAYGESFNGFGPVTRTRHRTFEAPDVLGESTFNGPDGAIRRTPILRGADVAVSQVPGSDVIGDIPVLSEWNDDYSEANHRLVVIAGRNRVGKKSSFDDNSNVAAMFHDTCRRCMVAGDMDCVEMWCTVTGILAPADKQHNVEQKAFVTGASLHGDILCSLCKDARDAECTIKFCEDPERDKNVEEESGVECVQGVCRWQKETVVSAGFNNYYNAWWQPNNLMQMFDQFTRDLNTAYAEFYTATSRAINVLG